MAVITTSGTVGAYAWNARKVIDHAFRRGGFGTEMITAENIEIAQDCISSLTSEWINNGFPLWTKQYIFLGPTLYSPNMVCPLGTVDILMSFWRQINPWRGAAQLQTGGDASVLFAGQPNPDVVIPSPAAVQVGFGTAIEVDTIGVLLGGATTITAALLLSVSADGITYTPLQSLPSASYAPGQWVYFDLDPAIVSPYLRLSFPVGAAVAVNQLNFGLANYQETLIGPTLNINDYYNLPDKQMLGDRVNSSWVDRQLNEPVLKIWPVPNLGAFYNGFVSALVRRYIQDPGLMTNAIEVPQRWVEALIWRLAQKLIYEIPIDNAATATNPYASISRVQLLDEIEKNAAKAESLAWSEERTRGPIRIAPRISGYTR